jgi:hypothetical protein
MAAEFRREGLHRRAIVSRRKLPGGVPIAVAAGLCLFVAACSPGADYPSLFPGVHDVPPQRSETPLDRNQVQQATEDLISARDRLSAEARNSQNKNSAKHSASSANASAARKQPVALSPPNTVPRPAAGSGGNNAAETK